MKPAPKKDPKKPVDGDEFLNYMNDAWEFSKQITEQIEWALLFRKLRGKLSQSEAAKLLSGPDAGSRCSVSNIQDWEQGRSSPPGWVQSLIVGQMLRRSAKKKSQF